MDSIETNPTPPQNTTFIKTCYNGINILIGIGLLSIPYALSEGGWLSIALLFGIAIICFYTGLLLKRCMDMNNMIRTYPDIGEHSFGHRGRLMISFFIYLELFLVAVELLIMEGDNLHKLFPHINLCIFGKDVGGKRVFIVLAALVMLPTTWLRNLSHVAYVSVSGILSSIILLATVFWIGAFEQVGFSEKGTLWRVNGIPTALSLYTFCYCGHAVFPTLYTSMRDKTQFPKVLLVCFVLGSMSYGSMAGLGYLMYGDNLMSQITLNLPTNKCNVSSKIAIYITVINPITKYAIIISPIATALEQVFNLNRSIGMSVLIRSTLVVSSVVIALVVPFFGHVMTFIGAFLGVCLSILFPCVCYLMMNAAARKFGMELMFLLAIIVFGSIVAVTGTFIAVRDIIKHR